MQTVVLDHNGSGGGGGSVLNGLGGGFGNGGNGVSDGGSSDATPDNRGPHCSGGTALMPLNVDQEVPSIMFALDRSPSMTRPLGTSGSRFSVTAKAITDTVGSYSPLAQFGYVEFPGVPSNGNCPQSGCCAGGSVPVSPPGSPTSIVGAISARLGACTTSSQNNCPGTDATPTGQALNKIVNAITGTGKWLYAVVLTDGGPSPNCLMNALSQDVCEETQQQISSMSSTSSSNTPISTFVVGIGDITPPDDCLTGMAIAGGHPAATAPFYISAGTDTLVHSQIDNIVTSTICNVDIKDSSFDANRPVEVDFGNSTILPDPNKANGWDLDRNAARITIYGPACNQLIQGLKSSSHHVVVKGCLDSSHASPPQPGF